MLIGHCFSSRETSTECLDHVENMPDPKRILVATLHSTLYQRSVIW